MLSKLYVSIFHTKFRVPPTLSCLGEGEVEVRLNILNRMVMLKVFGKPPLLRCGESYAFHVTQRALQLRHLSG